VKIYLAHNFAARESLRLNVIPVLEKAGHEVTSTWITDDSHLHEHSGMQSAVIDLADIERAGAIVFFSEQYGLLPGRGKFVELGYAIRAGKIVIIVGENDGCVFYTLPTIRWAKDVEGVLKYV
jgi:hypothetical protein